MNEFVDHTGLTSDVLYHSVYLFDQFLSKENTLLTNLQITGLICVLISSKTLKNITMGSLTIDEIYLETGGLFSKKEMDEMEKKILKTFGSNIKSKINSKYFLKYFIDVLGNKEKLYHLSSYICELSLLSYTIYTRFRPSEIAFSSIILSFYILGKNTIPVELQQFSLIDIKSKKINLLISLLNQIYIKASTIKKSPFSKKKYSKKNRLEVSLIKPPQIFIPTNNEN
ncbi:cyclin-a2-4 [Anaeramoeba flamelloides]|uniref:Cyclin-a2-4 n=1 Tax=Anaeramoeba flamelloides TaxID=1746091 RepID=A0AAV7Z7K6_9EUKA|nr:cyclin-a2-4 [Anaeramoeba flamelloides]